MSGGREGGLLFSLLKQVYNQLKKLAFPSELSHRVTRQLTRASAAARANTRGSTSAAEKLKRPQRNATCQVNGKNATTLTYFNQNKKTKIKLHTGHSVLCVICVIYIYIHLTHVSSVPACCLPHNQSPVIHKLVWKNLREASVVLNSRCVLKHSTTTTSTGLALTVALQPGWAPLTAVANYRVSP